MKKILSNRTHVIIGSLILAALVSGLIFAFSRHTQVLSTVPATYADIAHTVSTDGLAVPDQSVSLTFDVQGKVSAVYADVGSTTHAGDILAEMDTSQIRASIAGAQADVDAATAQLAKAENGARPEEKALYAQKYSDATTILSSAMRNAYLLTEDAVVNKSDVVFTNGDTPNPSIAVRTQSIPEQSSINQQRLAMRDMLAAWKNSLMMLTPSALQSTTTDLSSIRATTAQSLDAAKMYLASLSTIVGNLTVGNSGIPDQTITSYTTLINAANQEVIGAATAEQTADASWSSARDALALENAGAQTEDIQAQAAVLAKAQAALQGLQSQLHHSYIIAPFDGIITAMNVKIGQVFVPGISAGQDIQMMSSGGYKIEAYVPETSIGSISANQSATLTFDAFGPSMIFPATVSLVDPAPTVRDGANTYKVTLRAKDASALKPGLTANVLIQTASKAHALVVPTRSIISRDGSSFVLVSEPKGFTERKVETGITSADSTEITSGLSEGDLVARF